MSLEGTAQLLRFLPDEALAAFGSHEHPGIAGPPNDRGEAHPRLLFARNAHATSGTAEMKHLGDLYTESGQSSHCSFL